MRVSGQHVVALLLIDPDLVHDAEPEHEAWSLRLHAVE
jgi:hypothetical protein